MLQGLQVDCKARVGTTAIHPKTRCEPPALCSCRNTSRPFRQTCRSPALSKPKTVQTLCSFASAVSHTSVTAQSVTEAVAKATLDKPLFQHALHSIFSSLAWFGLAWIVTRSISRKSKECESPEVMSIATGCLWVNMPGPSQPSHVCTGAGTSSPVRAISSCTPGQASSLCPCGPGIAYCHQHACCSLSAHGSSGLLAAVHSLVFGSGACIRDEAAKLFRATWSVP